MCLIRPEERGRSACWDPTPIWRLGARPRQSPPVRRRGCHGDILVTADQAGARAPGLAVYDPFGQVEDPKTGALGTVSANQSGPDTQQGNADYGWLGQHQKLSEHLGGIATVEMSATTPPCPRSPRRSPRCPMTRAASR